MKRLGGSSEGSRMGATCGHPLFCLSETLSEFLHVHTGNLRIVSQVRIFPLYDSLRAVHIQWNEAFDLSLD